MTEVGDTINRRWKLVEELCGDSGQGNTFKVMIERNFSSAHQRRGYKGEWEKRGQSNGN